MSRFTTIKSADDGLAETFARNFNLDENTRFEFFQADPSKVQTACQVSQTGNNRNYQQNTQLQETNNPPNAVDKKIQNVIPINPHSILLQPKPLPRIPASVLLPCHVAIHQQYHNQRHRRDPQSGKLLPCHYAPWTPTTTMTSGLRGPMQHLTTPPPRLPTTMTPSGLGKRRRADWSSMNDDGAIKAVHLDTILEEEDDQKEEEEREDSGRFKRQRRR